MDDDEHADDTTDERGGWPGKRARSYQLTFEIGVPNERSARGLQQRMLGMLYMSFVDVKEFTLADITRNNFRMLVEKQQPRPARRARKRPSR